MYSLLLQYNGTCVKFISSLQDGGFLQLRSGQLYIGLIPRKVTQYSSVVDNTGYFGCIEKV